MNTIRFNTGRKYTAAGQRIVATYRPHNEADDESGTVTFFDHDRMVDGGDSISPAKWTSTSAPSWPPTTATEAKGTSALGRTACSAADATPT